MLIAALSVLPPLKLHLIAKNISISLQMTDLIYRGWDWIVKLHYESLQDHPRLWIKQRFSFSLLENSWSQNAYIHSQKTVFRLVALSISLQKNLAGHLVDWDTDLQYINNQKF